MFLIILNKQEVKELIKQNKNHNLSRTRNHHFMRGDDHDAVRIIAYMRGYDVPTFQKKCLNGLNYR